MKFLIDAQLPPGLCRWFEARGFEAEHVADVELNAASDLAIASYAEVEGLILVSKDDDFLTLRRPDRFALLWLRCGNTANHALVLWMDDRWESVEMLLKSGERLVELR
jgi:predicted nuclease of predicted toxin-antitoxin system